MSWGGFSRCPTLTSISKVHPIPSKTYQHEKPFTFMSVSGMFGVPTSLIALSATASATALQRAHRPCERNDSHQNKYSKPGVTEHHHQPSLPNIFLGVLGSKGVFSNNHHHSSGATDDNNHHRCYYRCWNCSYLCSWSKAFNLLQQCNDVTNVTC